MAPLAQDDNTPTPTGDSPPPPDPPSATPQPDPQYWTKANIATTTVFALLALIIILLLLAFYLRKRSENKKKKRNHRKSDHVSLLQNEDKTSMFSRERHSSVTLYLDHHDDEESGTPDRGRKRGSQDALSLTALQITPLEEVHDPMSTVRNGGNSNGNNNTTTASNGSGVSSISRFSTQTASTMMLSPITPSEGDRDLGMRPSGRPRSTSTASVKARYYDTTPTDVEMPPVPKIIRTPSD